MAPWALANGMVTYNGRLYIPPTSPMLDEIMAAVHDDGHEGVQRTLHRLRRYFHFSDMRRHVQDFVQACATSQRSKTEHLQPAGLLLPLPVPSGVWTVIGLDFIEALPKVRGKSVILTVVDRFSKYCHFIPLAHPTPQNQWHRRSSPTSSGSIACHSPWSRTGTLCSLPPFGGT